jgi:glycoprotein-N-acetylgalactosamine 3-beta-galactosyltransferase
MSTRQFLRSFATTFVVVIATIGLYSVLVWGPRIRASEQQEAGGNGAAPTSPFRANIRADQLAAGKQLLGTDLVLDDLVHPDFEARLSAAVLALERGGSPGGSWATSTAGVTSTEEVVDRNKDDDAESKQAELDSVGDQPKESSDAKEAAIEAAVDQLKAELEQRNHPKAKQAGVKKGGQPKPSDKDHKKSIEEKIAMWRQRDKFWLQQGALTSLLGSKCLDTGGGRWKGELKLWGCHKDEIGANQRFVFHPETGQIIQPNLKNAKALPQCLEVRANAPEGMKVGYASSPMLVKCEAGKREQEWAFNVDASIHKVWGGVQNKATGNCLTHFPTGRNTTNERAIVMSPCVKACNQTWSFGDRPVNWPNEVARVREPAASPKAGRILCWILTFPAAGDTKAAGVNNTWGRRCDTLLYMTTEHVEELNTVELKLWGPEGRDKLWTKSKLAWLHVYEHYRDKADWFIKADDDTYLMMDNLREFLSQYNTMDPHHFGRKFSVYKDAYYSGGSGIVLSKEALLRMGKAFPTAEAEGWAGAPRGTGPEDLLTSKSLAPLGVLAVEAVDKNDRQLFFPMGLEHEWFAKERDEKAWFYRYSKVAKVGRECCSENWVAVHYTPTPKMYMIDSIEELQCKMELNLWPHLQLSGT